MMHEVPPAPRPSPLRCCAVASRSAVPPPPFPRTNRISLVPPLVLSGHDARVEKVEEGFQEIRRAELQALYGGRRVRYILSVAHKSEFKDASYPVRPLPPRRTNRTRRVPHPVPGGGRGREPALGVRHVGVGRSAGARRR